MKFHWTEQEIGYMTVPFIKAVLRDMEEESWQLKKQRAKIKH